jgi:hypothetical protein
MRGIFQEAMMFGEVFVREFEEAIRYPRGAPVEAVR